MENIDSKYLENRIKADRAALEEMRWQEQNKETAARLHDIYQRLVDSGFTEEQAFYIFYEAVKAAWNNA